MVQTPLQIDDDVMYELTERSRRENVSVSELVNRLLREALASSRPRGKPAPWYREKTYSLGQPRLDSDRTLAIAATLEDAEFIRKMTQRD